jgi:hypothetical protein
MTIPLDELTVFILSRDRNLHLESTISYYKELDIQLVVLHKTKVPVDKKYLYPKLTYKVVDESYARRCSISLNYIDTPYAILSTDDERYLPTTLFSMLQALKSNNNIMSVGAQAIALLSYHSLVGGQVLYRYLHGYSNTNNDVNGRVVKHFANSESSITFSAMYRMYRSKDFDKMLKLFSLNDEVSTALITEVTSEVFSLFLGNIVYLDELLWIRNFMVEPINTSDWSRSLTFIDWWRDTKYESERFKWVNNLTSFLGDVNFIIEKVVINRSNEEFISNKVRYKYISKKFKYLIRRMLKPKSLPTSIEVTCNELKQLNIRYSEVELKHAIKSMRSPFFK